VNPHFASLILGLAQQAEAALAGQLEPDEKQLLDQTVPALRFRYVQTMPRS
jgi:hypothetical protein